MSHGVPGGGGHFVKNFHKKLPEAGSYVRLIDSCIAQLNAQGPSRTYNESKEEGKEASRGSLHDIGNFTTSLMPAKKKRKSKFDAFLRRFGCRLGFEPKTFTCELYQIDTPIANTIW